MNKENSSGGTIIILRLESWDGVYSVPNVF